MPTFDVEFKKRTEQLIIKASLEVSTEYLKNHTLNDFIYVDETSNAGKKQVKEVYDKVKAHYQNFENDPKLSNILINITDDMINETQGMLQIMSDVIKFESVYLVRQYNEYCRRRLTMTGMWSTELTPDDRLYLEPLICDIKLRYEIPNKYSDYVSKGNILKQLVRNITSYCETRGSIVLHEELSNITDINKIIQTFE